MVLRCRQHSIGYMGDGIYTSKDPTNSIKVLKEKSYKGKTKKGKKYKIHIYNYTCKIVDKKYTYKAQQVP